ncbi:Beta-fructofuranosidase, insoluble isoenzyme CWINV3 [Hibiscus syriacus]|uniref:Beta-fructofuranosidase, insoluble isoenzyme CWINV3 n=1 Tax=Hibiscus syriacus TaxID=106335 RepID=A0A6A3BDH5_HIBSY|nr:beta-fructofuranosidase, insoluble isoenzyme CWINV1-like isoform X2 [Hibiscus syriacus]KAE8715110.1 Beta-fructofuranosidase, insoluble isoenzyme CWINV3 [Hibiscus syriacus]
MAKSCIVGLFLFFVLLASHGIVELEASHHVYRKLQTVQSANQPYRTSYHFQPPRNWINGVMVYKGLYHLFYQYNPKGAMWGNIVWAHSTSKDLVNWTPHEPAIFPSQPGDINGCWSGSATILPGGKPAMLYTGIDPKNNQVQNLAVPKNLSDPFLREWVKSPKNPLMQPTAQNQINASSFRDPTTAWLGPDKKWRVIIGSKVHRQGMAILFKSKDFVNWVQAPNPLHSADGTGMWECPDFYPVSLRGRNGVDTSVNVPSVKHVLKVSLDDTKHDLYTIGSFDSSRDVYIPDKGSVENDSGLRYDYGKYYASKTFLDSIKDRRILCGWLNESSSVADDIKKGWAGVHAIPRQIWLDKTGKQLIQWPVVEIEKLRANHVSLPTKLLKGGSVVEVSGVTASQADVDVSFQITSFDNAEVLKPSWTNPQLLCSQQGASVKGGLGPFGLLVLASRGLSENTAVFFRIFKGQNKYMVLMCSDQSRSSLNQNNDKTTYGAFLDVDPLHQSLSLRSLIDHSMVESFGGGGKACMSARVYPTLAINDAAHLYVFNNGSEAVKIEKLNAWSMKKAKIN